MEMKQWENLSRLYPNKKAQAVLELAIFGSIIIMLLGLLLNYGLRYNFQQRVMQQTFRKALVGAEKTMQDDQPSSVSYVLIQDKHIPQPSNPFAVGSVSPFMSSDNVVSNYKLHEVPQWDWGKDPHINELPETAIQIQDQEPRHFKNAAFREENLGTVSNVSVSNSEVSLIDKYKEVYGDTNVWYKESCSDSYDEYGGTLTTCTVDKVRVIDSCEGELVSYHACKRQCRMIDENEKVTKDDGSEITYCEQECERGKIPGSEKNCKAICEQHMDPPWYCSALDSPDGLFAFAQSKNKPKAMGMQADYTKKTTMNNILHKTESPGTINTTDTIGWSDTTYRNIIYNDHMRSDDPAQNGVARADVNIIGDQPTDKIPNTVGESVVSVNCE